MALRIWKKRVSKCITMLMLLSMLLPTLAFADPGFKSNLRLENGTVTGVVYDDVSSSVYGDIMVNIYAPDGDLLDTVTLDTYSVIDSTYTYYGFQSNLTGYYNYVNLGLSWNTLGDDGGLIAHSSTVTQAVYDSTSSSDDSDDDNDNSGDSSDDLENIVSSNGIANAFQLEQLLKKNDNAELRISGDFVLLPASALKEGKVLHIVGLNGTYELPLTLFDYEGLAEDLDTTIGNLYIRVGIKKIAEDTQRKIVEDAAKAGVTVKTHGVDFTLTAEAPQDKSKTINDFGRRYVNRSFTIDAPIDATRTTVALWNENSGLQFVPSIFEARYNDVEAHFKRNGNSIYVIIQADKSFHDLAGHWAKSYVSTLANKLVVEGVSDTQFEPERSITRAEFAALIVRSIGLNRESAASGNGSGSFQDVSSTAWYAPVVAAAAKAGMVEGYEDGTFRPNAEITREELAAMVVRAMDYTGSKPEVSTARKIELLNRYSDSSNIVWGHNELAAAIDAGIIQGITDSTLSPRSDATRTQSATMLFRMLQKLKFMN
jgi:N-acetylmuramoyl-L-alanine amidase